MEDPNANADQIRNKRLAKLGSQGSQSPRNQPQSQPAEGSEASESCSTQPQPKQTPPPTAPQTTPRPQINITSASTTSGPSPSSQTKPNMNAKPAINISPATAAQRAASPQNDTGSGISRPTSRTGDSVEAFEEKTLSAIFKISLREDQQRDIHGQKLIYLPGLRGELEESGQPVRFSVENLDQALLEAASNLEKKQTPLGYLLPCWKRVARLHKGFRKPSDADPKYAIVKEARRLCLSYCIFAASMPEMFGLDSPTSSPLKRHLLLDPDDDNGICHDFLAESVKRLEEDDSIATAIVGAVEEMNRDLSKMNMRDDYKPYMRVLRNLVRFPALATAIANSPMFNQGKDASNYEVTTLLGPWFRLSPLQSEITKEYFSSPKTRDQNFILSSQRALRMTQQMQSSDLLDIVNHLIRASKETREKVLDWFATAVNINHKRRAMQVDHRIVSSDGFMFNITTCLDQLCEPFMDASFSKIDRIDVDYLRRNPRVDIKDETKLNADQHASDEFYSQAVDGTSNFITEIFFLTVAAHHYGSESLTTKLGQLDKDLRHMESQIDKLELERPKWATNPVQLRTFEEALKKYKDKYDLGLSYKYTLQGVLLDDLFQARSMQFMRYVIVWLLRLVSGKKFPTEKFGLPLPEEQPDFWKCLPEYFLEDIVSTFKFIMWHMPHIITNTQGDELVMLCISFLQSSEYIKNPYLKAGLATIMFRGTWPRRNGSRGVLVDLLNSMPFATDYLLHSLMKFYIEVEFTGTHTQFFDKFNIRYEIFQIVRCIWPNTIYRDKLSNEAKRNLDFFVRFVNLLLNDVTFVLDESFSAFLTIHDTQNELNFGGSNMEENVRQEKEEQLSAAQGRAKSYMQLTNETVSMLKLFTEALAGSFTMPEIVQRLADMLDYNLDAMVGPKSANLKVDNLQEYGFNPKALLSEIIDVYLNLMGKENFIVAVARDGRSYKPVNFEKAAELLRKFALKSQTDLAKWDKLQKMFKAAKEADDQAEEDLGEIPDDFLDPLVYTLMEDPVILPGSRVTMDRATIRSHLLSDPNDPFNRSPLKIEDVIPDTEMKSKIEAFKAERKAAARATITDAAADEMDTSAG